MAYTVDFTDGTKTAISVANSGIDTTTNIGLVGQGYKNYGEIIAENLLHMLENSANGAAPSKPIEGQLWYDNVTNTLKYFDDTVANSGNWKAIAAMAVTSTEPSAVGESEGHLWLDPVTGILSIYHSSNWVVISDVAGDTRVVSRTRYDTSDATHRTVEVIVNGKIVSITSSDGTTWQPQNSGAKTEYIEDGVTLLNTEFANLAQGITLNSSGSYFFTGTATAALYADLAERYYADNSYDHGTVVSLGGSHEITASTSMYDRNVFGVISIKPAFAMNSGAGDDTTHPYVALSGRIPVKVVGKVNKGDRLTTSSINGVAMVYNMAKMDVLAVIGRALEDKHDDGIGMIEMVVGTK